jgi:hypothetical protein
MSCGFGSPSTTVSPFSTCSPSNTMIWRYFGISSSWTLPSASVDDQALLALGVLAEADDTRALGEDRRILGLARLEQVGHARQTAGDVAGLRGLLRDTWRPRRPRRPAPSCRLTIARGGSKYCAGRSVPGMRQVLAVETLDDADRSGAGPCPPAAALRIGDLVALARPVRSSVFSIDGDAVDEVDEAHETGHFRDDRVVVRIPVRDRLAGLDRRAVLDA